MNFGNGRSGTPNRRMRIAEAVREIREELDAEHLAREADEERPERISTSAYLKTMWNVLKAAFTHPLTPITIDLTTGDPIDTRG